MPAKKNTPDKNYFERFASWAAKATGSSFAFIAALAIVVGWAATGPIFHYSETWQLVINTGTTIITFLMVFLIQKAQNKDSMATQLKLSELIAANEYASNRIVYIEGITELEMETLSKYYQKLAQLAKDEENFHTSRSIDSAEDSHELKKRRRTAETKNATSGGSNRNQHSSRTPHKTMAAPHKSPVKTAQSSDADKAPKSEATTSTEEKPKPRNKRRRPPRKGPAKPAEGGGSEA